MVDIDLVDTVTVGPYEVRVGPSDGGWEAVVVSCGDAGGGAGLGDLFGGGDGPSAIPVPGVPGAFAVPEDEDPRAGGSGGSAPDPDGAPVVEAPHKWVAAGLAVEAHEFEEDPDQPQSAEEIMDDVDGLLGGGSGV
jgi:hypothetical protein